MLESLLDYLICGWKPFRSGHPVKGGLFFAAFFFSLAFGGHYAYHGESPREVLLAGAAFVLAALVWVYYLLDLRENASLVGILADTTDETLESLPRTRQAGGKKGVDAADDLYSRGRIAYLRGSLDEAKNCFEKLLRTDRTDTDATFQLGRIYKQMGENRLAERLFRQCKQLPGGGKWSEEIKKYLEENKD